MTKHDNQPIRVVIVDDHHVTRRGLLLLLDDDPQLTVAGEAANREDALTVAQREHPDVILLDLSLGRDSGLDLLPDLLALVSNTKVVIFTGLDDAEIHARALGLGAKGVVLKGDPLESIVEAIRHVHNGGVWMAPALMAGLLAQISRGRTVQEADPEAARIAGLTEREREIVILVAEGVPPEQIAARLFITEGRLRNLLTGIFKKLGVADSLQLVIYAYRNHIIKLN